MLHIMWLLKGSLGDALVASAAMVSHGDRHYLEGIPLSLVHDGTDASPLSRARPALGRQSMP